MRDSRVCVWGGVGMGEWVGWMWLCKYVCVSCVWVGVWVWVWVGVPSLHWSPASAPFPLPTPRFVIASQLSAVLPASPTSCFFPSQLQALLLLLLLLLFFAAASSYFSYFSCFFPSQLQAPTSPASPASFLRSCKAPLRAPNVLWRRFTKPGLTSLPACPATRSGSRWAIFVLGVGRASAKSTWVWTYMACTWI